MSNILSEVHPELVAEWSDKNLPLTSDRITYGSNKVVWWKGACGHEWQTSVKARSNGENCPICSGARVIEGINDLATLKPELADEWSSKNDPLKPTMVTTGSHKKVIWQDKYGHEWTTTVKSRALNGTGCPYCSHTKLQEEKSSVSYDVLEMSGSRAVWKEVLAVYSVKVNTDPDNPQEVATMDESKKQLLTDIFWEMNEISSSTDTKTETVITETDDGHGNIVETESTVTQTYLYITVSHKTADEMAAQYGFNEEQKEYLAELLADENNSLWSQVLYGITGTDDQIVTVALSQIGTMGGDPYWSWYGFYSRVEWCACFVSWCANECGYIDAGVIPKYAGCVNGVQWFKDRGQWLDNSAEPTPGMIIFFDWADESGQDGLSDHTGIVQKVENGRVYTVEGNSGDSVRQNSYPVGYYEILGYGAPAY